MKKMDEQPKVIYPHDLSCFKYERSDDEVDRSSILDTLELHFAKGETSVAVHGDEGIGKTTVLNQFISRYKKDSIGIFLNAVNGQSYAQDNIIIDLYRQASYYLNDEESKNFQEAGKRDLAKVFYFLEIFLQKKGKFLYLIIDGLSDIPKRDHYIVDEIIDLLPFTSRHIKILLSVDNEENLGKLVSKKIMRFEMLVFSKHETKLLLPDVDESTIDSLMRVFPAVPGNLKIIKRLISSGMSAETILQDYSSTSGSRDLYEAEWNRSKNVDDSSFEVLAIAAFSISPVSMESLQNIFSKSTEEIERLSDHFGYIDLSAGYLYFSSKGMKLFVREKLAHLEDGSLNRIVDFYQQNPDMEASLSEINIYNDKLGRYGEIIGQLSNENISRLFKKSKSLNEAIKQIKLGRRAANELSSLGDTLRLSHAESILSGLRTSDHLENELKCYLADDDYESAMALTSEAEFVEERLQLLAAIASHQKTKKDKIDEDIERKIDEDFEKINPENMGIERTTDLASELFVAFPEKALSLINRVDSLDQSGGNKTDYALFRLSMNMVRKNDGSIEELSEKVDLLEDKKKNVVSMLGLFKRGTPAEKILEKIEKFSEPSDAIFVLRNWITTFPKEEKSYLLIEKLLSLIISTTDYHANASVYADISTAIQYLNSEQGNKLLSRLNADLPRLKRIGPSTDYVRLQCNLIIFEEKNEDPDKRIEDLKLYLFEEIEDLSTKLSSFGITHYFSKNSPKISEICNFDVEKNKIFNEIIENCADHIALLRDALIREVSLSFENAVFWALGLNTRPRRDLALSIVIKEVCKSKTEESTDRLCQEVRKIKNIEYRNEAIIAVFDNVSRRKNISKADIKRLMKARNRVNDSFVLCDLNILLLVAIQNVKVDCSDQRSSVIDALNASFNMIEGNWLKIDVAYRVYRKLAVVDESIAQKYRESAIELRKSDLSHNESIVNSQLFAVDLVLRSFHFLCKQDLEDEESFSLVRSSIESLPSRILRIKQWARLCSALRLTDKSKYERQIINENLSVEYDGFGEELSKEFSVASFWALPILFKDSKPTFERKLRILSRDEFAHDEVIAATQRFILNKTLLGDPFDPVKKHKYVISSLEIESYVFLVEQIKEESRVFFSAQSLVDIIVFAGRAKFSNVQKDLVGGLLQRLINYKFDGADNIDHSGYKICCTALLYKLKGFKNSADWEHLIEWVEDVSVISDRVFILTKIIDSMPASLNQRKKQVLREAVELIDSLKCGYERLSRCEMLADVGVDIDKPLVKKLVERAVLLSTNEDSEAFEEKRLGLIDSLYSMDKDFASSLSAMVDDDPARKSMIEDNIKKKNDERLEKEGFDVSSDDIKKNNISPKYPRMLWSLLAKMNAGNHVPNKKSNYQKFLDSISQHSFEQAYPMLSYFIHVRASSSQTKHQTRENIKPIFDILVNGIQLFRGICAIDGEREVSKVDNEGNIVFGEGESDKVLDFVRNWVSQKGDADLVVIDPYFGLSDLQFIGEAINKDPEYKITVLTSFCNLSSFRGGSDSDPHDEILRFWNENVTSDSTPQIDVVFCGVHSQAGHGHFPVG